MSLVELSLEESRRLLETFVVSEELAELETRFARFNVFEALGVARREIHHSSFLAFLLNPQESHGLRDYFTRRFLQEVVRLDQSAPLSAIDLDNSDLSRMEVKREYANIDIFLRDPLNKIVAVIENKVGTKQHDNQLAKYHEFVSANHPDFLFIGVYLTPTTEKANNPSYTTVSYKVIRSLVAEFLSRESVLLPATVRTILEQYADLLGRRFMADAQLIALCEQVYRKHRQAIDILRRNLPDEFGKALSFLSNLVSDRGFFLEESDATALRFLPTSFKIPAFQSETRWLKSGQVVYLECKRKGDTLVFQAKMDGGSIDERKKIHSFTLNAVPPFRVEKSLYARYQVLYSKVILEMTETELGDEALEVLIKDRWGMLIGPVISEMEKAVTAWQSGGLEPTA